MGKRKNQPLIDSDSDSAVSESELLSLAKKKKSGRLASTSPKNSGDSSESDWDSDDNQKKRTDTNDGDQAQSAVVPATNKSKPDSEPEEGEVSDSDDGSGSSSSDDSSSEFNDGYDENLMGDEEDRKRLEGLSEKERETELYKRIERREMMRTRWEIERKLRMAKRAENQDKKPKTKKKKKKEKKAPAYEAPKPAPPIISMDLPEPETESPEKKLDTSASSTEYFDPKERSKERKKNVEMSKSDDKRSNAMAMLKAKREGKAKREEEEAKKEAQKKLEEEKEELEGVSGGKSSVKLKASDIYSDDSDGSESEDDKASERRSTTSSKSSSESEDEAKEEKAIAFISTNAELNKLRLSRYKMERFINLPHFEKVVNNCFVRVSVGNSQGQPVYRVGQIVGVVETAKVYQFGKNRTNKRLRLKHGTQDRVFRLEFISNQDFTDQEFLKWKKTCEDQNVPLPTVDMIEIKQKDVKEALYYEFKDEDIDRLIEEKQRFRAYPTNFAMKKTQLMKEREAAINAGDDELVKDLNLQVQELEERASELDKKRSSSISLISYINNRNRRRNVEDAEKAILEEARANKGVKIDDPFTRRSTQPTMLFKAKKQEEPMQLPEPIPPPSSKKKNDDKKAQNGPPDNNLYSLHDFDIDLDVPLPAASVNVMPKPVEKVKESGPKRSLNLEDYKKKRGLI